MTLHAPCALKGPVTQDRPWWSRSRRASPRRRPKSAAVRTDLVASVRRQIAAGTYDTPERWEKALDKLAEQLTGR
jgi:hypothetical protein